MWKINIIILLFSMASCHSSESNLLANKIEIATDSCCILVKNIDNSVLEQLVVDSISQDQWQSSLAIYHKVEDDLQDLEKPLTGNYRVEKEQLVFKPNQPFKKGEYYLVELYLQNPDGNLLSKLKSSGSPFNQQPIQKTIKF